MTEWTNIRNNLKCVFLFCFFNCSRFYELLSCLNQTARVYLPYTFKRTPPKLKRDISYCYSSFFLLLNSIFAALFSALFLELYVIVLYSFFSLLVVVSLLFLFFTFHSVLLLVLLFVHRLNRMPVWHFKHCFAFSWSLCFQPYDPDYRSFQLLECQYEQNKKNTIQQTFTDTPKKRNSSN